MFYQQTLQKIKEISVKMTLNWSKDGSFNSSSGLQDEPKQAEVLTEPPGQTLSLPPANKETKTVDLKHIKAGGGGGGGAEGSKYLKQFRAAPSCIKWFFIRTETNIFQLKTSFQWRDKRRKESIFTSGLCFSQTQSFSCGIRSFCSLNHIKY